MKWPVRMEFATFQCSLTRMVSFSRGVAPRSVKSLPVAVGVTTLDEIEQRLYRGIRLLGGEITPEEFNMYEYQRGGGFDPSVYSKH